MCGPKDLKTGLSMEFSIKNGDKVETYFHGMARFWFIVTFSNVWILYFHEQSLQK